MEGTWFTVRVKDCEAFGLFPLLADNGDRVGSPGAGGRRARQRGRAVAVVGEGHARGQGARSRRSTVSGLPLVVTVKLPALPAVKVVLGAEVMAGAHLRRDDRWSNPVPPGGA